MLRKTAEWWALLDAAPDFVRILDRDGRILYLNHTLPEFALEQVVGTSVYDYMPRDQRATVRAALARVFRTGTTDRHEVAAVGPGVRLAWYANRVVPIKRRGRVAAALLISTDVTARKQAEQALHASQRTLRALSHKLLQTQEAERTRIARDLHDQIGQALTAVKLNVEGLHRAALEPGRPAPFTETILAIERAIEDVRALSFELRPPLLDDLGLAAAVAAYAKRQAERAGLTLGLAITPIGQRVPQDVETVCFRVVQEAITNVVRHSGGRRLDVALRAGAGALLLEVRDDGCGFDTGSRAPRAALHQHIGLVGMQERAELVGGEVAVQSQPGAGTVVCARFPLPKRNGSKPA